MWSSHLTGAWYALALTPCSPDSFMFRPESVIIAEVALLICIVIFCKIMSWPLTWESSMLSPFQISSLHLRTKILLQFFGIGYFDSLSLNLSPEIFWCYRLFTITARCGDILGPWFSSSAKSIENWSKKGSVWAFDLVEILPDKSNLSGEFLAASILATSVTRYFWSGMLILSSGISSSSSSSSSEISTYLLPPSALALLTSWSLCTHVVLAQVSVLVWVLKTLKLEVLH